MKLRGSFHFLRRYIVDGENLSDQEFRLLQVYRSICDWDMKHNNFGTSNLTTKEIQKSLLPSWSTGKISGVRKKLLEKGELKRLERSRFGIKNPEIFYRKRVKDIEQTLQCNEQGVQLTEREVQMAEQRRDLINRKSISFALKDVQTAEQNSPPKETLKKDKEPLKNEDFRNNPWRDPERREAFFQKP